jgi:guanylate kinase
MSTPRDIARRGIMLVVSSPSGAGKTTLTRNLLEQEENVSLSISVTTRVRRPSEIDGVHYHFISKRRFEVMRDSDELLESAEVHGNLYGTPREPVERALASGRDVLFDIDWQGARQLRSVMAADVASVFILPPDGKTLERRLRMRAQDSDAVMAGRLAAAAAEIAHWGEYDYLIVNADLDDSLAGLTAILAAERLKRARRHGLEGFVRGVLAGL